MIYVSIYFLVENSAISENRTVGNFTEVSKENKTSSLCLLKVYPYPPYILIIWWLFVLFLLDIRRYANTILYFWQFVWGMTFSCNKLMANNNRRHLRTRNSHAQIQNVREILQVTLNFGTRTATFEVNTRLLSKQKRLFAQDLMILGSKVLFYFIFLLASNFLLEQGNLKCSLSFDVDVSWITYFNL